MNNIEIRKFNAVRGWIWVTHGVMLIMRSPLLSIVTATIAAVAILLILMIPMIGPILAILLMPVLIAGYARICRALEEEEEVELPHLFAGFQKHSPRLIALGGFLLLGLLIASVITISIGGETLAALMDSFKATNDPDKLVEAMWSAGSSVTFSLAVGIALTFALMMAFQFAPMLIFFSDITPFVALRDSLIGTLRNFIPYTVYSIIMQLIALLLSFLPFNLGLIILLPLGFSSLYVSYRNIFPFPDEIATTSQPAVNTPESRPDDTPPV
jgi:uncharacterized membrane protein